MKINPTWFYRLNVRPTVVVSTVSKKGISNAAPFSFNSPISIDPPLFGISSQPGHDTWRNIQETGEFVINLVGADFGPLMKVLAHKHPYEVSEIKEAGLTEVPSSKVRPPRIAEAYGWLECKMIDNVVLGDHIWITGEVLEAEVKDECFDKVLKVEAANPLNHISGSAFVTGMKTREFER
jgi:flavin reductase (DIM6/NTAB) family NADH-FMN oxidoreductase RutF